MADLADEEPEAAEMVGDRLTDEGEAITPLPWCRWAWRAWHELTDDRHWRGGGMGPATPCNIPWSVVRDYARDHGHDLPILFRLIRSMDAVFTEWWGEQVEKASEKREEE